MRIIKVTDSLIVGQLVHPERLACTGYCRKVEHRVDPARQVAKRFAACGFGLAGDIPDVVVGVVSPAAALRAVLIQRMPWLAERSRFKVGKDAIYQHSRRPAPHLCVERLKNSSGPFSNQDIKRSGSPKEGVSAFHPDTG